MPGRTRTARTARPRLTAVLALLAAVSPVACDARSGEETSPESGEAPEEEARRGPAEGASEPDLSVSPERGPPGSEIRIEAVGLPPNHRIRLGAGPVNSEYEIIAETRSDADGRVEATLSVPSWAEPGRRFVFVAETPDHATKVLSDPFPVTEPGESPEPTEDDEVVEVTGALTDEGVECQALRGDDGRLYTLVGELEGFGAGDRVRVEGERVEMSFCMQGETLRVVRIEGAGDA